MDGSGAATATVKTIFVCHIKSCRGISVAQAPLNANGSHASNCSEMRQSLWIGKMKCLELLIFFSIIIVLAGHCDGNMIDVKVLSVGEELFKETLPLQHGVRMYQLKGLKPHLWYEVKISYPASIPSSFSLQLKRGTSDLGLNPGRKLLNTEKLIFKADELDLFSDQGGISVLVTVEPEGVVAIPGIQEREFVVFNIVCDELLIGIPHKAWYVVVMVILCLVVALVAPSFLPPFLLPKNGHPQSSDRAITKDS